MSDCKNVKYEVKNLAENTNSTGKTIAVGAVAFGAFAAAALGAVVAGNELTRETSVIGQTLSVGSGIVSTSRETLTRSDLKMGDLINLRNVGDENTRARPTVVFGDADGNITNINMSTFGELSLETEATTRDAKWGSVGTMMSIIGDAKTAAEVGNCFRDLMGRRRHLNVSKRCAKLLYDVGSAALCGAFAAATTGLGGWACTVAMDHIGTTWVLPGIQSGNGWTWAQIIAFWSTPTITTGNGTVIQSANARQNLGNKHMHWSFVKGSGSGRKHKWMKYGSNMAATSTASKKSSVVA